MCEHEYRELRTIGCSLCKKTLIELDLEQQLAAANARVAELEKQKPSYKKEFDCVYEKLKAEEKLSAHYKTELEAERNNRVVTCVYCGMDYPEGTPTSVAVVLTEHIRICEKHPMRELECQLAAANARVEELEYKLMAQTETALQEKAKREQAEARMKRMEDALKELLRLYVRPDGTIATLTYQKHHYPALEWEKAKAALEEK